MKLWFHFNNARFQKEVTAPEITLILNESQQIKTPRQLGGIKFLKKTLLCKFEVHLLLRVCIFSNMENSYMLQVNIKPQNN